MPQGVEVQVLSRAPRKTTHMESHPSPKNSKPKIIFFDNSCPMCTVITEKISASGQSDKFELRPIVGGSLPSGVSSAAAEKEIHVVDADGKIYKGSEAMLKIAEEYPGGGFWAKAGNLPGIKQILAMGYALIAANRHFIFGRHSRIFYLKIVVACAFIAGFLLSMKLWLSSRFYPLTPVLSLLPKIPFPADYVYFFVLLLLLVAIILLPKPRIAIGAFSVLLVGLFLLDQSRLQPWAYQYLFILIGLGLFSWLPKDKTGETRALNGARIIIVGTYIWSGIQKINPSFIFTVFPWLTGPLSTSFPAVLLLGLASPIIEFAIGLGLLTKRFRNLAVWVAVVMHVSILIAIGPLGRDWNSVIWPWQIAMICFVLLLFYNAEFRIADLFGKRSAVFLKIIIVLFLIMPLFNFFGLWDSYLSSALYSGDIAQGTVYMDSAVKDALPAAVSQYATSSSPGEYSLSITDWSSGEMNTPSYPEARIFKNVTRYICGYATDPMEVTLVVQEKPTIGASQNIENYTCSNL
jgi:predicted DCC family thiol-disulfide oxidoreductase YuxK